MAPGLTFSDDEGTELVLDAEEAACLLAALGGLDEATVSACPDCRSRVIASVAFVDLLDAAGPHSRTSQLVELADDAPTLHLYVRDDATACPHMRWRDPLYGEWLDVVDIPGRHALP